MSRLSCVLALKSRIGACPDWERVLQTLSVAPERGGCDAERKRCALRSPRHARASQSGKRAEDRHADGRLRPECQPVLFPFKPVFLTERPCLWVSPYLPCSISPFSASNDGSVAAVEGGLARTGRPGP